MDELSKRWRRGIAKREKLLARTYDALTLGLGKKRPKSVPKDATFNRTERHWELEPRDGRRRAHGVVTFYRVDGTLAATATYHHGTLHGPYTRFHESGEIAVRGSYARGRDVGTTTYLRSKKPTSELAFDDIHEAIVKIECDYVRGCLRTTRWFDKADRLVTPDGDRWPPRPAHVPLEACFNGGEGWVDGGCDEQLARHGIWRFWDRRGRRTHVIVYDHGREKRVRRST